MDKRRMTATETPCPRGSKTSPCGTITVIGNDRAACSRCRRLWSLRDLDVLRAAIRHRPPKPKPTVAVQVSLLEDA